MIATRTESAATAHQNYFSETVDNASEVFVDQFQAYFIKKSMQLSKKNYP